MSRECGVEAFHARERIRCIDASFRHTQCHGVIPSKPTKTLRLTVKTDVRNEEVLCDSESGVGEGNDDVRAHGGDDVRLGVELEDASSEGAPVPPWDHPVPTPRGSLRAILQLCLRQDVSDRDDEEDVLSISRCHPSLQVDPNHSEVGVLVEDRAVVWE